MFLAIETSVSTMLAQQNLATMRALNAAFGDPQAAPPAPAQPARAIAANITSAVTSVALRQQVVAAADAAVNNASLTAIGSNVNSTSAALSAVQAAYAEVINPLNQ
jgi:hypothetical protein